VSYVLDSGRRMAESRMTDKCAVTRPGVRTWNENKGEWSDTPVSVYSGVCRLKHSTSMGRDVEAASQLLTVGTLELHVPVGTAVFEPDDLVTISASATRADQVGRKFRVVSPFDGTQTTAIRYKVEVFDGRG